MVSHARDTYRRHSTVVEAEFPPQVNAHAPRIIQEVPIRQQDWNRPLGLLGLAPRQERRAHHQYPPIVSAVYMGFPYLSVPLGGHGMDMGPLGTGCDFRVIGGRCFRNDSDEALLRRTLPCASPYAAIGAVDISRCSFRCYFPQPRSVR